MSYVPPLVIAAAGTVRTRGPLAGAAWRQRLAEQARRHRRHRLHRRRCALDALALPRGLPLRAGRAIDYRVPGRERATRRPRRHLPPQRRPDGAPGARIRGASRQRLPDSVRGGRVLRRLRDRQIDDRVRTESARLPAVGRRLAALRTSRSPVPLAASCRSTSGCGHEAVSSSTRTRPRDDEEAIVLARERTRFARCAC